MLNGKIPSSTYRKYAEKFTAAEYDPAAWAALAKRAGMRYIVITSKHHDGFALFDSKVSDWDAVDSSAAKRDLIKPLAEAARKEGLRFGPHSSTTTASVAATRAIPKLLNNIFRPPVSRTATGKCV